MKVFNSIQNYNVDRPSVLTLGTFDGLHVGHKKIISKLLHYSRVEDCESVILTFSEHPRLVLNNKDSFQLLTTLAEKQALFERTGLQNLVIHPFDEEFSNLTPREFVKKILIDVFKIKMIIIGYDHRFGKDRAADINDLIRFGDEFNFKVHQIPAEEVNEVTISSTKIRDSIAAGNLQLASKYLGYQYFISGEVIDGKKLGRTIGFPTANIKVDSNKLIPAMGVYIVKSVINDRLVYGMMNIGVNPTVGRTSLSIEVHYLNFEEELYGTRISVTILEKLRNEIKFSSVDELIIQLNSDRESTLKFILQHS